MIKKLAFLLFISCFLWAENTVNQDVVDATMKNMQTYVRNLYVNETSISEEIDRRLEALKVTSEFENKYYDDDKVEDYDKFELDGYNEAQEFKEDY